MKKRTINEYVKYIKIIIFVCLLVAVGSFVKGESVFDEEDTQPTQEQVEKQAKESMADSLQLDEYISTIDGYVASSGLEGISFQTITQDLMQGNNVNYESLIAKVITFFAKEMMGAIKGAITVFLIVILMAIISALELDKNSDITKIAHLVCFLTLATVTISTFIDTVTLFKNVVGSLTTLMQVISPFLMAVLIATGAISSTGIVQPLLLFIASSIGFLVNYLVIPFLSISVAFKVICSISENIRLDKMSKMFSGVSIWVIGIVLTVFLGILSLETSLTSSVDSLGVKATQTAVSNFVPVVGKFFSDSFETVVGATKIIGRVGGTVGIIAILVVAVVPIIKIASIMGVYSLLSALIEPMDVDGNVMKYISGFAETYKVMLRYFNRHCHFIYYFYWYYFKFS